MFVLFDYQFQIIRLAFPLMVVILVLRMYQHNVEYLNYNRFVGLFQNLQDWKSVQYLFLILQKKKSY